MFFFSLKKKADCINHKLHTKMYVIVPALCRFTSCCHIIADVITSFFQVSLRDAMTSQIDCHNRLSVEKKHQFEADTGRSCLPSSELIVYR